MEEDKTQETPIQPVVTTIIGTGDGAKSQTIKTPEGQPDIRVEIISPLVGITSRFIVTFLTSVVGLLGAGSASTIIPASDFLDLLWKCCALSLGAAVIGLFKDLITVFTRLTQKFPLLDA